MLAYETAAGSCATLRQDMLQAPMLPPDVALCALLAEARRAAEQGRCGVWQVPQSPSGAWLNPNRDHPVFVCVEFD